MDAKKEEKELKKGRWSTQEHHLFLLSIGEFGRDWKSIQTRLASRSLVQIRSHAQKYFDKAQTNPSKLYSLIPPDQLFKDYFVFLRNLQTSIDPQYFYIHKQQAQQNDQNGEFALNLPPNIRIE